MSARRAAVLLGAAVLGIAAAGCGRRLLDRGRPAVERVNRDVSPGGFRIFAIIAGGGASLTDLQLSSSVRQQLEDSGFTVVRRAGRWDSQLDAVRAICDPGGAGSTVDGVLFVWYNRIELRDCATERTAYDVSGEVGLQALTGRLIRYLRGGTTAQTP